MKKIATIFLLVLMLLNIVGYRYVFNYLESKASAKLDKAIDAFQLIASELVVIEYTAVFNRKKFDSYLPLAVRDEFIADLMGILEIIRVKAELSICRDPGDNKFLDLAVQGNAKYIISGDDDLLTLHPFQNIQILTPADFMAVVV